MKKENKNKRQRSGSRSSSSSKSGRSSSRKSSDSAPAPTTDAEKAKLKSKMCLWFLTKGKCTRGDACHFGHDNSCEKPPDSMVKEFKKKNKIKN